MSSNEASSDTRTVAGIGAHEQSISPATATTLERSVLADFVNTTATVADQVVQAVSSLGEIREKLREHLTEKGFLHQIDDPPADPYTIAAIDGAMATQRLFVTEILAVAVVSAEGIHNAEPADPKPLTWADHQPLSPHNSQLAQLNMLFRELRLLTDLPHKYRIIDGTHLNPFIAISRALNGDAHLQEAARDLLTSYDITSAGDLLAEANSGVVSLAKADTQTHWASELRSESSFRNLPMVTDKVLTAVILEENEMLTPFPISLGQLSLIAPAESSDAIANVFTKSVAAVKDKMSTGLVHTTYFKPHSMVSSLKMQFTASDKGAALQEAQELAAVISRECFGPTLLEPYPQYAADKAAKNVSVGLRLIEHQIMAQLPTSAHAHAHAHASLLALNNRSQ